ncbi:MAG: CoA-disulfide reductase, partial [Acidimicrobiaceae bacterium]|nr:CoA-disulfide reductase [Acidimicrobiaceae bacterium]
MRIAVIGGGAAGIGAAGAAKGVDPDADVVVYTADTDVAYSPCGIPYVHGKEIDSFDRLFLATKEQYVATGIDVHYETTVEAINPKSRTLVVAGEGEAAYDRLVIASGWNYAAVDVPGADLDGIYEVKYIREAMEWDKRLDSCQSAVVVDAGLVAMEMVAALCHRGIECTVVDPAPWPMADVLDPDIVEPVRQAWEDAGVDMQWGNRVTAFRGDGTVSSVETQQGRIEADIVIVGTHKVPNNPLAAAAGLDLGSTGGLIVDSRMQTSDPNIYAAGDCTEIPHGVSD